LSAAAREQIPGEAEELTRWDLLAILLAALRRSSWAGYMSPLFS
jgi:hypothetical protein